MSARIRVKELSEQITRIIENEGRFVADPGGTDKEKAGARLWDSLQEAIDELSDH